MRYIIFEDFSGRPLPLIFPGRIDFDEIREIVPYSRVLSAGEIRLGPLGFECFGEAKDLGVKASPEDVAVIAANFAADVPDDGSRFPLQDD